MPFLCAAVPLRRVLGCGSLAAALVGLAGCATQQATSAQTYTPASPGRTIPKSESNAMAPQGGPYQPERTRVFDLIHTRLELEPIWDKRHMKGLATITLTPHIGKKQELELDAKGMEIRSVKRIAGKTGKTLVYKYDGSKLNITLDSAFAAKREIVIEIDYTAKPDEAPVNSNLKAITSDKGLYFINPLGTVPNRPRELWTQGETESNSHWFPTIEATNQKMTQEIQLTVDTSFTTLSNGVLVSQTKLAGGKRIDVWELKLPHAPYLAMLAVGPFTVIKDKYKDMEVSYYVEKPFRARAAKTFANTPEMLDFFSKKLGVPYAWPKYSQVVGRDYVSGAMENTTATLHMEDLLEDDIDKRNEDWDLIIAHELFHHWFGDLVTAESWANLTLNESFANYSEYLWLQHKKGQDEADFHNLEEKLQYLYEAKNFKREPVVRFHYNDPLQMFDSHSYAKGGLILNMLRSYVGDEAFFASLHLYLTRYKFQKAEQHQLRMCFEEVTGEDMNWFFDQWFYKPGHPELKVQKSWTGESVIVSVSQIHDTTYTPVYRIPFSVDVWHGDKATRHNLVLEGRDGTFELPMERAPSFVQFDPDHALLAEVRFEAPNEEMVQTLNFAPRAIDRAMALERLARVTQGEEVNVYLQKGMKDRSHFVRDIALELCNNNGEVNEQTRIIIANMAKDDKDNSVRATATGLIGNQKIEPVVERLTAILDKDQAYAVQAEALHQYNIAKGPDILGRMKKLEASPSPTVVRVLAELYAVSPGPDNLAWFKNRVHDITKDNQYAVIRALGTYSQRSSGDTRAAANAILESLVTHQQDSPTIKAALKAAVKNMDDKDPARAALEAKLVK